MNDKINVVFSTDDEIMKSAVDTPVTNNKLISFRGSIPKCEKGGLYDDMIFGRTGRCVCKRTVIGKCPQCGITVYDENDYENLYSYYKMHAPFIINMKLEALYKKLQMLSMPLPNISRNKLINIWSLVFVIDKESQEETLNKIDEFVSNVFDPIDTDPIKVYNITKNNENYKLKIYELNEYSDIRNIGPIGLKKLKDFDFNGKSLSFIDSHINQVLPIVSPYNRPWVMPNPDKHIKLSYHQLTQEYAMLILLDTTIGSLSVNGEYNSVDIASLYYLLNLLYDEHIKASKIFRSSKQSAIRNSIPVRVTSSMRANAISYNKAKLNEVYLPMSVAYHALQGQIIRSIVRNYSTSDFDAYKAYENMNSIAMSEFHKIFDHCQVLMLRNPTLHRNNLMQFTPRLWDGDMKDTPSIGVCDYVCKSYNLDFDGDQLAIFFVTDPKEIMALGDSMKVENLWIFDKDHSPAFLPSSTCMYGLYCATKLPPITDTSKLKMIDTFENLEEMYNEGKIEFDEMVIILPNKIITYGREKLNRILGHDISEFCGNEPITMKEMTKVISGLYNHPNRVQIIHDIREFGNEIATLVGIDTLPMKDIYKNMSPEIDKVMNDSELTEELKIHKIMGMMPKVLKKEMESLPNTNLDVLMKGSRISAENVQALYTPYIRFDNDGKVKVGDSTVINGLGEEEYINSIHSQRQILQVKAGAVSREGFMRTQSMLISSDYTYNKVTTDDKSYVFIRSKFADKDRRCIVPGIKSKYSGLVPVYSNFTSNSNKVYKQQVSEYTDNITVEGARIGMTFFDAFVEPLYQAELKLKYGGLLNNFTGDDVFSVVSGEKAIIDGNWLKVGNWNYLITKSSIMAEDVVKGNRIIPGNQDNLGTRLMINGNMVNINNRFDKIYSLFEYKVSNENKTDYKKKMLSYSPYEGKLEYKNNYVYVGGNKLCEIKDDVLYLLPDGWDVKFGDRICTATLDIIKMSKICPKEYLPVIFYDELLRISPVKWSTDLVEIILKCLLQVGGCIDKGLEHNPDFINRMIFGSTNKGMKTSVRDPEKIRKDDLKTEIELNPDNPFLKLIMRTAIN